jgi:hypothetical protein
MQPRTRRSVLAAVGASAAAGCLSATDGDTADQPGTEAATTAEPTDSTTADPPAEEATTEPHAETTEATTGDWVEQASNSPDPDHEITLRNEASASATLRVAVVREATGETVFETTEAAPPGTEGALYNLREADPEGVESFRVCAELVGEGDATVTTTAADSDRETDTQRRDCATIDTSECYGNAHVTLAEDGSVQIIYAIC